MSEKYFYYPLILIFLGVLFFLPGLGAIHLFDWDEINFAEASREMILSGNYTQVFIDFQPFWEKPPLFFWLQAMAMKAFGINEFATRLPNAISGIITLLVIYQIGRQQYNKRFGFLWALAYLGSVLPHLYFRSGIIDPIFNLFIFLGLYGLIRSYWAAEAWGNFSKKRPAMLYLLGGGFSLGLAILTKGPAALLIVGLCIIVYWVFEKFRWYISFPRLVIYGLSASFLTLAWFGLETWKNGTWFVEEFITYQIRLFSTEDAGHGGFPGYHLVVLLVGCFPASVFALGSLFSKTKEEENYRKDFIRWMKILFWVVLILFSIVQSKIVHYSSLCYFPLTYLAAIYIQELLQNRNTFRTSLKATLLLLASIYATAILGLVYLTQHIDRYLPLIDDPFVKEALSVGVGLPVMAILPALWLLLLCGFFFFSFRKNKWAAIQFLFIGNAVFIFLTLFFWIGPIEQFSQGKAIDFWEAHAQEDAYRMTYEFKSYAPLFYGQKKQGQRKESRNHEWLLKGDIDKPVYIVCKIHKAKELKQYPDIQEIKREGGFVFFLRQAK